MDMNTAITLEPKTRKARNRLAELKQAMTWGASNPGVADWAIEKVADHVGFDASSGPWLFVRPICGRHIAERFGRWVHATSDRDFAVHEV